MRFPEGLELRAYGQQLLAGREAKGWTQKQLSEKLFLPVPLIRALEAGEPGMLPEIPYVMSMYRKAATAVGVDPEPMIQACREFQAQKGLPSPPGEAVRARKPSPPAPKRQSRSGATKPAAAATPQHTPPPKAPASKGKNDWVIVLVGSGLGLALVAMALLNRQQLNNLWLALRSILSPAEPPAETVEGTQDQLSEDPASRQQITDTPAPQPVTPEGQLAQQPEALEPGTVRFIFTAGDDNRSSWIRIEDGRGVLLFENTPEPSTNVDLPIAAGVRVRAGRPGLVRWQQPGQPPQALPDPRTPGVWIELIPSPVAAQPDPAPPGGAAPLEAPAPAPEPENAAPPETTETP